MSGVLSAAKCGPGQATSDWDGLAAEIERLNRSNPREALATAERWLAAEQANGSAEGYARALRSHAHALLFMGMHEAAVAEYEDAAARFETLGLNGEAARTRIGHVTALRRLGRYQEAVELAQDTRAYFLDRGDELQAAKQANNLGTLYRPMGKLTAALEAYREARAVFRRLGERSSLADVEQNMGNVLKDLGRYDEALAHLRVAERIRRALRLPAEVAYTRLNIGALSSRRGDYGRALQALMEARRIYEELGVQRGVTEVDLELLLTCAALNLREESMQAAERAIAGLRAHGMQFELGQALLSAGALAQEAGDLGLAHQRTEEARQLFVRTGNRLWEAMARLREAQLLVAGTQAVDLRATLRGCQEARHHLEAAGALDRAAFGRLVEGSLLARLQATEEALSCFRQALDTGGVLGADHLLYQAHAAIGQLLEPTEPSGSIAAYRHAIEHMEAVRARALADDLKLSFLADKTDLYERVVALLIQRESPDAIAEAHRFMVRSKSRTLLEELLAWDGEATRRHQSRTATLARQVRNLRTRLNTAYMQAYGVNGAPSSGSAGRSRSAKLVAQLEGEFARATRELQLAARGGPRADDASIVGSDLAVPHGTVLVEYYAAGAELLAFVTTEGGLRLRRLGMLEDMAELADSLSFHIGKAAFGAEYVRTRIDRLRRRIEHCLRALWERAIAPLESDLAGRRHLVVVPHGPLHGLPFHAFHDGAGYLAEHFSVAYAPNRGVYQRCRHAARPLGDRVIVLGVDDPNLPWVAREIEAVARAWPRATVLRGKRATGRALRHHAGTFDALHLATHANFRADNPAFSSVRLADGWLTVGDLRELVRGSQLVTLSACETGVGGLAAGDEVVGLTRGILAAGCSTVVASLWPVSDETTALLMGQFYAGVCQGVEPAEALRSAMLALRAEHDHPYFWAPFVVMGGGRGHTSEPRDVDQNPGSAPQEAVQR